MKLLSMKDVEASIMQQAKKLVNFIKKHKKLIAVITIFYIASNFLFSEDDE